MKNALVILIFPDRIIEDDDPRNLMASVQMGIMLVEDERSIDYHKAEAELPEMRMPFYHATNALLPLGAKIMDGETMQPIAAA